jgi:hypothetical protein
MQQPATPPASPNSSSFAGLLASLTAPAQKRAAVWSEEDLADDFATISYESALRAHARPRIHDPAEQTLEPTSTPAAHVGDASEGRASPAAVTAFPPQVLSSLTDADCDGGQDQSATLGRNLKCSSITIRLSKTECAQLRRRAKEAGLTVSAYLRSCTFEAETLRAQVKETLAELRLASSKGEQSNSPELKQSWLLSIMRFFPLWHGSQRRAPA